ncbi:hypothetical protein, partial [Brevundimonas vesicularis]|uniref:hypothetical protein n=1 Tax=Brevundimonas vesicularis TaxID=41276 RepID=UPI0028AC2188
QSDRLPMMIATGVSEVAMSARPLAERRRLQHAGDARNRNTVISAASARNVGLQCRRITLYHRSTARRRLSRAFGAIPAP